MAAANASTFLGIQIETAGALAEVADIARLPDVDLLFVGPSDLSQVLGVPGDFDNPRCLEAIESVATACAEAGKPWESTPRPSTPKPCAAGDAGCSSSRRHPVLHTGIRAAKERYAAFFSGS